MKKIMLILSVIMMMSGCTKTEEPAVKASKTCSTDISGMKVNMQLHAEDDIVKTMDIDYNMSSKKLGTDASKLTKKQIEEASQIVLSSLGVKEGKGIQVDTKVVKEDLAVTLHIDLNEADASVLKMLGITGNVKNVKLSDTVKEAKQETRFDFVCE